MQRGAAPQFRLAAAALLETTTTPIRTGTHGRTAGGGRPIQHDCIDDRISGAIGNAIRSLT